MASSSLRLIWLNRRVCLATFTFKSSSIFCFSSRMVAEDGIRISGTTSPPLISKVTMSAMIELKLSFQGVVGFLLGFREGRRGKKKGNARR
ncbi:unnamed protein product, partial [Vitis vinifera]